MFVPLAMLTLACAAGHGWCGEPDAPPPSATQEYHVRALDPRVREWIRIGGSHSPTFRALLDRLTASDVIVYLEIVDQISSGADGHTIFVAGAERVRYLRIQLTGRARPVESVALLGHELQHAVEVADAPCVRNPEGFAALYRRDENGSRQLDSVAARAAGRRITDELASRPSGMSVKRGER
jgi:hypothetical protein